MRPGHRPQQPPPATSQGPPETKVLFKTRRFPKHRIERRRRPGFPLGPRRLFQQHVANQRRHGIDVGGRTTDGAPLNLRRHVKARQLPRTTARRPGAIAAPNPPEHRSDPKAQQLPRAFPRLDAFLADDVPGRDVPVVQTLAMKLREAFEEVAGDLHRVDLFALGEKCLQGRPFGLRVEHKGNAQLHPDVRQGNDRRSDGVLIGRDGL